MAEKAEFLSEEESARALAKAAVMLAEDQVEVIEGGVSLLKRIIWNHKTHVGVAFVVGAGVGGAVTYKVAKDRLATRFEAVLEEEIARAKEYYSAKNKTGEFADPVALAEQLDVEVDPDAEVPVEGALEAEAALRSYQGGEGVVGGSEPETDEEARDLIVEEVKKSKKKSIFENSTEDFNWDEELLKREQAADTDPFIITQQEFFQNEEGYENKQLTLYEKDNVLADEADTPVQDVDGTVGDDNLRFGYGSEDPNIVYVRNPRVQMDMEIVRSEGSYAHEVLHFDDEPELRHSARRRRFRESDE